MKIKIEIELDTDKQKDEQLLKQLTEIFEDTTSSLNVDEEEYDKWSNHD